jgi:hypothetical protein
MPFFNRSAAILLAGSMGLTHVSGRAAAFEETLPLFSQASSLMQEAAKPIGMEFFVDYYRVFQGNPLGGQSQAFAYSQYLPFGFKLKGSGINC